MMKFDYIVKYNGVYYEAGEEVPMGLKNDAQEDIPSGTPNDVQEDIDILAPEIDDLPQKKGGRGGSKKT